MSQNSKNEPYAPPAWLAAAKSAAMVAMLALGFLCLTTGCHSTKPSYSRRMAHIVVTNQPSEKITAAINNVFTSHAYEETTAEEDELVYQKPGSFMNSMVYGDWYSGGVWERIRIYQRELDTARTVVECDGYMVQEHDDPMFQKEKRQYGTKKHHLQDLMNEVAVELDKDPAAAAPSKSK